VFVPLALLAAVGAEYAGRVAGLFAGLAATLQHQIRHFGALYPLYVPRKKAKK